MTPSVALLIISPFKSLRVVVVAPPRKVANPVTESVLPAETAPVKVEVVSTVSVPPVLIFVLIVVDASTTATTKNTDKITDSVTETGPLLKNTLNIFFM